LNIYTEIQAHFPFSRYDSFFNISKPGHGLSIHYVGQTNGSRAAKIKAIDNDNLTYTRIEAVKNVALFLVYYRFT